MTRRNLGDLPADDGSSRERDSFSGFNNLDEPFRPTLIPWQNYEVIEQVPGEMPGVKYATGAWSKRPSVYGPFTEYTYGSITTIDTPGVERVPGLPSDTRITQVQVAQICSPKAGFLAVDVDSAELYDRTDLAKVLPRSLAWSEWDDGNRCHIPIDAREFAGTDVWPERLQGPVKGGDIKAAGYIPLPGSVHKSGGTYAPTGRGLVKATREIMETICRAKELALLHPPRPRTAPESARDEEDTFVQGDDSYMAAYAYGLCFNGWGEEEAYEVWQARADEVQSRHDWPFTRTHFNRHWRGARRKYEAAKAAGRSESPGSTGPSKSSRANRCDLHDESNEYDLPNWHCGTCYHEAHREEIEAEKARELAESRDYDVAMAQAMGRIIEAPEEVGTKREAEQHVHPLSRDWSHSPPGSMLLADWAWRRMEAGDEAQVSHQFWRQHDQTGAVLSWLLHRGLFLVDGNGVLYPLPDRERDINHDRRWINGRLVDMTNYPGAPEGRDPLAGRQWGPRLLEAVKVCVLGDEHKGKPMSRRQIAQFAMDNFWHEGLTCVSIDMIKRALKELERHGELLKLRRAQYHRQGHQWHTTPAVYVDAADYPDLMELSVEQRMDELRLRELRWKYASLGLAT